MELVLECAAALRLGGVADVTPLQVHELVVLLLLLVVVLLVLLVLVLVVVVVVVT